MSASPAPSFEIPLPDEAASLQLGEDLALAVKPGDTLLLRGDLGAGKSTLARALIRAMADDPELEVPSPTFTLVQSYELRIPVAHFDLYRLGDPDELVELGLDELSHTGICLIEWPERAEGRLPKRAATLDFAQEGEGRRLTVSGDPAILQRLTRSLEIRAFLDRAGLVGATRRHLTGDASVRGYERIRITGEADRVLMDSPRAKPGPILEDGLYYQQLAHIAEDVRAFVGIDLELASRGFAVPGVEAGAYDQGLLLVEELGRDGILDGAGRPIEDRYHAVAEVLAALHAQPFRRSIPLPDGTQHKIPDFDRRAMKIETRLLLDWYLPHARGTPASEEERASYSAVWDQLIDRISDGETNLLLRDVHSPNILWRPDKTGIDRVGLIDFQDAMIGPTAYDLASLIQDARVDIAPEMSDRLCDAYIAARRRLGPFDEVTFRRDLHVMEAQRNCKLLGIWVRLKDRDGKPGYMQHMPRTMEYLERALAHPVLAPLHGWLRQVRIL